MEGSRNLRVNKVIDSDSAIPTWKEVKNLVEYNMHVIGGDNVKGTTMLIQLFPVTSYSGADYSLLLLGSRNSDILFVHVYGNTNDPSSFNYHNILNNGKSLYVKVDSAYGLWLAMFPIDFMFVIVTANISIYDHSVQQNANIDLSSSDWRNLMA